MDTIIDLIKSNELHIYNHKLNRVCYYDIVSRTFYVVQNSNPQGKKPTILLQTNTLNSALKTLVTK